MAFIYDLTDTWNAGGTTFNAIKMNVTDSASAAASRLISLQVGGSERFSVDKAGIGSFGSVVRAAAGSTSAPAFSFTADTNTGMWSPSSDAIAFSTAGSERLRIDSAGNVGVGVTPSAWWASTRAFDLGANASLFSFASGANVQTGVTNNAFINSSIQYIYKTSAAASNYLQNSGEHIWFNAPSGTAGNAVTFTQAMTLNASGNLGIGTSSPGAKLHVVGNTYVQSGTVFTDTLAAFSANLTLNAGNFLAALTGGSERMRIDSSGNVGIGTSSPNARLHVAGNTANTPLIIRAQQNSSGNSFDYAAMAVNATGANGGIVAWATGSIRGGSVWVQTDNAAPLILGTNDTERMRIDSSGNLLVGTTATASYFDGRMNVAGYSCFKVSGSSITPVQIVWNDADSGDNEFISFFTNSSATFRGGINYNRAGGVVAYNTTSDYRAKDILGPVSDPGATIDALKVYNGKMKGATIVRPMLIAHEAQEVVPYAVTGEKDAVNEDGTDKYQQMDHQVLIPLLIAEIQSLRARVAQLEGN